MINTTEQQIVAQLAENLEKDVRVLTAADLSGLQERQIPTPSVHVIFRGTKVRDTRPDGKAALISEQWMVVACVSDRRRDDAKESITALHDQIATCLMGFYPQGASGPLKLADAPPPGKSENNLYLPVGFVVDGSLRAGNVPAPVVVSTSVTPEITGTDEVITRNLTTITSGTLTLSRTLDFSGDAYVIRYDLKTQPPSGGRLYFHNAPTGRMMRFDSYTSYVALTHNYQSVLIPYGVVNFDCIQRYELTVNTDVTALVGGDAYGPVPLPQLDASIELAEMFPDGALDGIPARIAIWLDTDDTSEEPTHAWEFDGTTADLIRTTHGDIDLILTATSQLTQTYTLYHLEAADIWAWVAGNGQQIIIDNTQNL